MCDVVFITPNMEGEIASESMGTLSLASILRSNGIACDIIPFFQIGDLNSFQEFVENAIAIIEELQPKIVSFYTRCDVYHVDLKLAEHFKKKWPDLCVVCGGPQSDITAEETLQQIPYVDYICRGEGERTVYPFFLSILQGKPNLSIPGLVYRTGERIAVNSRPEMIKDLNELPILDYSLLQYTGDGRRRRKYFPIEVGRGCPFGCTFCSTNSFWGRNYRLKSPERILQEIKDAHHQYGVTEFKFTHDMFTLNRSKVIEICNLIRTLDFSISWACSSRLDCLDPELIDIMAASGMIGVFLGIETGSPRMQRIIKKNLKLDNAKSIIAYMKSKNILAKASFIFGFPEETEEDLSQTIALIGELLTIPGVTVVSHLCAFFVGSELSKKYEMEMTPVDYYSNETGAWAVEECKDLIDGHPNLFLHMLEYKTDLRSRLKYFELFIREWAYMQPVYQYISEKYSRNNLVDMYYDFVEANKEIFDDICDQPEHLWVKLLAPKDHFPSRFADDENYDLISDWCRYQTTNFSDEIQSGAELSDFYCFNPMDAKNKPLQKCQRALTAISWSNKKRTITVYGCISNEM